MKLLFFLQLLIACSVHGQDPLLENFMLNTSAKQTHTAKIIIQHDDIYLFNRKKCEKREKKNNRLELYGGKADSSETPFQTLLREIEEEDPSLTLLNIIKKRKGSLKSTTIHTGKQVQTLYLLNLNQYDFMSLIKNIKVSKESYGPVAMKLALSSIKNPRNQNLFTPMTVKMIQALSLL